MSDFGWFKLLVRALGVLFLGLGVPHVLQVGAVLAIDWIWARGGASQRGWGTLISNAPYLLAYGAQAAFGYYLLMRGQLLIEHCLLGVRGRCAGCGYDLAAVTGPECPECGSPIRRLGTTPKPPAA